MFTPNQPETAATEIAATETNADPEGRTFCAVHPTVETALRCNKCGRYMCAKCSVPTPVGYRCKQCIYQQQDTYYNATIRDNIVAVVVSIVVSVPLAYIISQLGLLFIIILGIPAGGLITELVIRATGKRRGRQTWLFVAGGIIVGTLIAIAVTPDVITAIQIMLAPGNVDPQTQQAVSSFLGSTLLAPLIFTVMVAGTAIVRLRPK